MQIELKKVALAMGAVGLLGSGYAYGAQIVCNGSLTGAINGNVLVKQGTSCFLDDAQIYGNLDVKGGLVRFCGAEDDVFGNVSVSAQDGVEGTLQVGCEGTSFGTGPNPTELKIGTSDHAGNLSVKDSFLSSDRGANTFSHLADDTLTVYGNVDIKNSDAGVGNKPIVTLNVNATGAGPKPHNLACKNDDVLFDVANVSGKTGGDGSCLP